MKTDSKKYPLFVVILFLLFAFSCKDAQKTTEKKVKMNFSKFEVLSLTEQSFVPGVESNIRNSIRYEWEIKCKIENEIELTSLIVDSVKVPISSIIEGEKNRGRNGKFYKGEYPSIEFTAARIIFLPDAPYKMVEEIVLEGHTYDVEPGHALLEFKEDEEFYTIKMGAIEKKKTIINP